MPRPLPLPLRDVRALGRLAIDATTGVTSIVEAMHATIASVPGPLGRAKTRARGLSGLVYGTVRGITRGVGYGLDSVLQWVEPLTAQAPSTPQREALVAALNGVLGDHLVASDNPLAIAMRLRVSGQPLALTRDGVAQALPDATPRIAVVLHGLCMNDLEWQHKGFDYAQDLRALGFTPLHLHYNTGRHISENGRDLSGLLEHLLSAWPTPVEDLVLVGHSMGGLVSRSACHLAERDGRAWLGKLSRMVFLGTPHHGSPLEKGGHWIDLLLGVSPYSKALTRLGMVRSAGITDLRHGSVQDADWLGRDRFAKATSAPAHACPLPAHVRCYALAAALTTDGVLVPALCGDGLVRVDSALGHHTKPTRRLNIPPERQRVLRGLDHMDLLGHEAVRRCLVGWLSEPMHDTRAPQPEAFRP